MTIGRNNEAPAAYALTSTIIRLLDHLTEANLFSAKDLESMDHTLNRLSKIVNNPAANESAPYLENLLAKRIERCRSSVTKLQNICDSVAEPLRPTGETLVSILRQMAVCNTKSKARTYPALPTCLYPPLTRPVVFAHRHAKIPQAA